VLERLNRSHAVAIVARNEQTAAYVAEHTDLPILLAPDFADLAELYEHIDPKVALYCNNGMANFQSLLHGRILHVHINHGESDKHSMVSNNAKAYDRVFVAGEAAVQRHRGALMELDDSKLVRVGRPQLDLHPPALLAPSSRRTVLYAPTWEGDADYNDYTSVDLFGHRIMSSVLALDDVRLVYKPHPKITTSLNPAIRLAHDRLLGLLARAVAADPEAGHEYVGAGDILAVFAGCDAMITDVSSVGLDWLYLQTDKPIFLTDPRDDSEQLRQTVPVSRCADVIDSANLGDLTELLDARLANDEHHIARVAMRHHYFDDNAVGQSTERFLEETGVLIALRDRLIGTQSEAGTAIA